MITIVHLHSERPIQPREAHDVLMLASSNGLCQPLPHRAAQLLLCLQQDLQYNLLLCVWMLHHMLPVTSKSAETVHKAVKRTCSCSAACCPSPSETGPYFSSRSMKVSM